MTTNDEKNDEQATNDDTAQSACNGLLDAVKAIRKSDCGAWLKDCTSGLFHCSDGSEKRLELMRLLDKLYKAAGI